MKESCKKRPDVFNAEGVTAPGIQGRGHQKSEITKITFY